MKKFTAVFAAALLTVVLMLAGCVSAPNNDKAEPGVAGSAPGAGSGSVSKGDSGAAKGGNDAKAQEDMPDFLAITGLDKMQEALDNGVSITSFTYVEPDDPADSFKTDDPNEIKRLWDGIVKINIKSVSPEFEDDQFPESTFILSNGDNYTVNLDDDELEVSLESGVVYYNVSGGHDFWDLIDHLEDSHNSHHKR